MDLREYLFRNKITVTKFAKEIQCSRNYLNLIVNGKVIPGRRFAQYISDFTKGQVTLKELGITNNG